MTAPKKAEHPPLCSCDDEQKKTEKIILHILQTRSTYDPKEYSSDNHFVAAKIAQHIHENFDLKVAHSSRLDDEQLREKLKQLEVDANNKPAANIGDVVCVETDQLLALFKTYAQEQVCEVYQELRKEHGLASLGDMIEKFGPPVYPPAHEGCKLSREDLDIEKSWHLRRIKHEAALKVEEFTLKRIAKLITPNNPKER